MMVLYNQQNVKLFLAFSLYDTNMFSKVGKFNDVNFSYVRLQFIRNKIFPYIGI